MMCPVESPAPGQCSPEQVTTRQEWSELTANERLDYIDAVKCMNKLPPKLATSLYPGVHNRREDFVATHINYTTHIHASGIFLGWHRHFIWLWEQALRNKCQYTGSLPYWNWALWASDMTTSPLFDGSNTSLGSDGEPDPTQIVPGVAGLGLPQGNGGGCVHSGPFTDLEIHLGPFHFPKNHQLPENAFADNPRCLTRNINNHVSRLYMNQTVVDRLLASRDIVDFQHTIDHGPIESPSQKRGPHPSTHISLGMDLEDLFASPQDPSFMLHHGMVDRMWTMWQAADERDRRWALNGTGLLNNPPTAPLITLDSWVEFGALDEPKQLRKLMDPLAAPHCYRYS
ncbi:di-copper centre [Penicillium brevicompactum]